MSADSRTSRARELYLAFAAGDRAAVEDLLTDDFAFSSPVDPALDIPRRADLPGRGVLRVGR